MYCSIKNYLLTELPKLADLFQNFCMLDQFAQGPYTLLVPETGEISTLASEYSKLPKIKSLEQRRMEYDDLRTKLRAIVLPEPYPLLDQGTVTCQTLATSKEIFRILEVRGGRVVSPFSGQEVSLVPLDPQHAQLVARMRSRANRDEFTDRFAIFHIKGKYFNAKATKEKMSALRSRRRVRGGGYFANANEIRGICVDVIDRALQDGSPQKIHSLRLLTSYNYELFFVLLQFYEKDANMSDSSFTATCEEYADKVTELIAKSDELIQAKGKDVDSVIARIGNVGQGITNLSEAKSQYQAISNAFVESFGIDLAVDTKIRADNIRRFFIDQADSGFRLYRLFHRLTHDSGDYIREDSETLGSQGMESVFFAIPRVDGDSAVAQYETMCKLKLASGRDL